MEKRTLSELFTDRMFRIPDYQRGYAWEQKQWDDFIEDLDALVDEDVNNHYTGTIVTYQPRDRKKQNYGTADRLMAVDVVDGQQRLTTISLYLAIVIKALQDRDVGDYDGKIPLFLHSGSSTRLILGNDTRGIFYDLVSKGTTNTNASTTHQIRLVEAYSHLQSHVRKQIKSRKDEATPYLKELVYAILGKLGFTYYEIEEECEIGMTFELMNSRGKGLSTLELLKNYLMHWISRNVIESERGDLTARVNKNWKEVYSNIGLSDGDEEQCLRIAWTIYCDYAPRNWKGYDGFKEEEYIPIRRMSEKRKGEVKSFIESLCDGLAVISKHYAAILRNEKAGSISSKENFWLSKLNNTGSIATFLPLMIVARIKLDEAIISSGDYDALLDRMECFAYRVIITERRRSDAAKSAFYHLAYRLFRGEIELSHIIDRINRLIGHYSPTSTFHAFLEESSDWYVYRRQLKYTLFEYEIFLLDSEGKGKKPRLSWSDLDESTIEHIMPQTPRRKSQWSIDWSKSDTRMYLHDIGNLVLTVNNSNYQNFEFDKKKGKAGSGICYANSDIRQERRLASFTQWTPGEAKKRREELVRWVKGRWAIPEVVDEAPGEVLEEDEEA